MKFLIKCPESRLIGAQGIWYHNEEYIEAETLESAITIFKEKYETRMPVIYMDSFYFANGVRTKDVYPEAKEPKDYGF